MRGEDAFEDALLLGGVVVARFVGDREMRAHAREAQLHVIGDERGQRDRVVGRAPDAVHARVDLQVHAERIVGAVRAHRLRERVDAGRGVHERREAVRDHGLGRGGHRLRQHEDRRVDAGLAQLHTLLDQRDREAVGAGLQRGPAHRDRAVAVAVGLHHRAQRAAGATSARNDADVRADRREVDLGPDGPERVHVRWSAR